MLNKDKNNEFDFINTFPPLGHPEHHFNRHPEHPWLKTKSEIEEWLRNNMKKGVSENIVEEDLTVSSYNDYVYKENDYIPVQFREAVRFKCDNIGLKSGIGTPYFYEHLSLAFNEISNFDGIGEFCSGEIILTSNNIKSFKGMPRRSISLDVLLNDIKSWDGFTSSEKLMFWQNKWDETSFNLLLNTPKAVNKLLLTEEFLTKKLIVIKEDSFFYRLDMDWLESAKKSKNILEELSNQINERDGFKRRKL